MYCVKYLKAFKFYVLTVLEKCPVDVPKTSRKDVCKVTSFGRPQEVNFELVVQVKFHGIIFNFISPNMCLKD